MPPMVIIINLSQALFGSHLAYDLGRSATTVKHSVSRFVCYTENLLHFNLADFPVAYKITAVTHTCIVMGNSKNLHIFKFAILLKSRKFDAREIKVFYIM